MKMTLHLKATDSNVRQARQQVQKQFEALLELIKPYNAQVESMKHTVTVVCDIEVVLSDEVEEDAETPPS